jgi:hypothetical protein
VGGQRFVVLVDFRNAFTIDKERLRGAKRKLVCNRAINKDHLLSGNEQGRVHYRPFGAHAIDPVAYNALEPAAFKNRQVKVDCFFSLAVKHDKWGYRTRHCQFRKIEVRLGTIIVGKSQHKFIMALWIKVQKILLRNNMSKPNNNNRYMPLGRLPSWNALEPSDKQKLVECTRILQLTFSLKPLRNRHR